MSPRSWIRGVVGAGVLLAAIGIAGCASDESASPPPATASPRALNAVVYRSPTCSCCKDYETYLRRHGMNVTSEVTDEMDPVKADHAIPGDAQSCHTVVIGDYAIEGHVPIAAIEKLLDERPDVDGVAIPGMPTNAPGMGEPDGRPLEIVSFNDGNVAPFVTL